MEKGELLVEPRWRERLGVVEQKPQKNEVYIFFLFKISFSRCKSSQGGGYICGSIFIWMPDGFLLTHWLGGFVVYKIGSFSFEMVSHGNCVLSWVKIGIRALLSVFFFFLTFFFIIFSVASWPS